MGDGPSLKERIELSKQVEQNNLRVRTLMLREASHVRRCHTVPHHGEYTVGKHSHDALTLLYLLWPGGEPPARLVRAVHFHDAAERQVGDLPAHVKWARPDLADSLARAELAANHALGIAFLHELDETEREWLHAVDVLELWLWACDQVNLGNQHLSGMLRALEYHFETTEMPEPVREFFEHFQWERTESVFGSGS